MVSTYCMTHKYHQNWNGHYYFRCLWSKNYITYYKLCNKKKTVLWQFSTAIHNLIIFVNCRFDRFTNINKTQFWNRIFCEYSNIPEGKDCNLPQETQNFTLYTKIRLFHFHWQNFEHFLGHSWAWRQISLQLLSKLPRLKMLLVTVKYSSFCVCSVFW